MAVGGPVRGTLGGTLGDWFETDIPANRPAISGGKD